MQGIRIQLDDKSRKNKLYSSIGTIKTGLQSVKSIGYDIASMASPNPRASILHSRNQSQAYKPADINDQLAGSILNSPTPVDVPQNIDLNDKMKIERLARLALADQELNSMGGRSIHGDSSGADLVMDSITESIIAASCSNQIDEFKSRSKNTSPTVGQTKT